MIKNSTKLQKEYRGRNRARQQLYGAGSASKIGPAEEQDNGDFQGRAKARLQEFQSTAKTVFFQRLFYSSKSAN